MLIREVPVIEVWWRCDRCKKVDHFNRLPSSQYNLTDLCSMCRIQQRTELANAQRRLARWEDAYTLAFATGKSLQRIEKCLEGIREAKSAIAHWQG